MLDRPKRVKERGPRGQLVLLSAFGLFVVAGTHNYAENGESAGVEKRKSEKEQRGITGRIRDVCLGGQKPAKSRICS